MNLLSFFKLQCLVKKKYDTSDFVMIVRQTTVHSSRSIISA